MSQLLNIKNLHVQYRTKKQPVCAVQHFQLQLKKGQIICIIGESGSGKTSIVHALLRILPPYTTVIGQVLFQRTDILNCDEKTLGELRGKEIFYLSQHPMNSFHPSIKIGKQLYKTIGKRIGLTKKSFYAQLISILYELHFQEPENILKQYPFQLSAGMLQRLNIASAFLLKPTLIVADEPTSSLDTDVQKQILQFISNIKQNLGTSYLIVTHDLGVVAEIADYVIVMKNGWIIEENDVNSFFNHPKNEYTRMLLQTAF